MLGHWQSDCNADGSIKDGLPSIQPGRPAPTGAHERNKVREGPNQADGNGGSVMSFTVYLACSVFSAGSFQPGPLV